MQSKDGILIQCDEPTMEVIMYLNNERHIVIERLDSTHVLCYEKEEAFIRRRVAEVLENISDQPTKDPKLLDKSGQGIQ